MMPNTYDHTFTGLRERGFMTPTYLSSFVMLPILPPQIYQPDDSCSNIGEDYRSGLLDLDGIDTIELKHNTSKDYQIYYCGNAENACNNDIYLKYIPLNKNLIFWNYPGVGYSAGPARSVFDLIEAGYKQAKRLLDQGVPANNITLYGRSLGGGVAAQVARRLHEEGHMVHLRIERSFSSLAPVAPEMLKANKWNTPFFTSLIALSVSGVALGMITAGLIASIGLVLANLTPSAIAPYINATFDLVGSFVGLGTLIAGALVGALVGLALGTLLSIQFLWTNNPLTVPMTPAFSALLYSTCCEMDSVSAIRDMRNMRNMHAQPSNTPTISVTNTVDDKVIRVPASLNVGLGFKPGQAPRDDVNSALKQNINSMWYRNGGHNAELKGRIETNNAYAPR